MTATFSLASRRWMVWAAALLIIISLSGILGMIFWQTRVRRTFPVRLSPGPGNNLQTEIPDDRFRAVFVDDPVEINVAGRSPFQGRVTATRKENKRLVVLIRPEETKPDRILSAGEEIELTLRAQRLIGIIFQR